MESFKWSCCLCICKTLSGQKTALEEFFTGTTDSGRSAGGCNFRSILLINVPKRHREKIHVSFVKKLLKSFDFYSVEPSLYRSITDDVEVTNTQAQGRLNHSENSTRVKVSRRTQEVEIYLAVEGSGLAFFLTDLGHICFSGVGNEFGVMWRGKGTKKPEVAYDIVQKHSVMLYTDLNEYNTVGDTKTPLMRSFLLISVLKAVNIITAGQLMNYQSFSTLQFKRLLQNSFRSFHIDLRDTSGEKTF